MQSSQPQKSWNRLRGIMAATPNPHYAGAPARMLDGRIFTDYRANCQLLPILDGTTWADHNRRVLMRASASARIADDRRKAVLYGGIGRESCVDTMLPEFKKRVYEWDGLITERVVEPVGLGTGRFYLPGRPDLLGADPDLVAMETIPSAILLGTHSAAGGSYAVPIRHAVLPSMKNRYSAPYGNQ
jgi:hypothetical protein